MSTMSEQTELLGAKIDKLAKFKTKKIQVEDELKAVKRVIADIEKDIRESMEASSTEEARSTEGNKVTIVEVTLPHVQDWDALYKFIEENKYWHLLQKRASTTGYRELLNMGKSVPGVLPYTSREIKFTGA